MEAFSSDLSSSKLFLSPADSVGERCGQYISQLSQLVEAYAPLQTLVLTSCQSAPWYSTEIASEKTKRCKFERCWRKSQLYIDRRLFEDPCELVRNMLKNVKQSYCSSIISENASDQKAFFNNVDRLLYRWTDRQYPSGESSLELCNNFSDFLVNKITKIRTELANFSTDDIVLSFTEQLDTLRFDTMLDCFIFTTETELHGLILKSAAY